MKKILNIVSKIAIMISVYSYLLVSLIELFSLRPEQNVYAYWSLNIGLIGIAYVVQKKLIAVTYPQVLAFLIEDDGQTSPEEMAKIARVSFTVLTFLISTLTLCGILIMIKGYNVLNELGALGYVALFSLAILTTNVYLKWGYPEELAAIDEK